MISRSVVVHKTLLVFKTASMSFYFLKLYFNLPYCVQKIPKRIFELESFPQRLHRFKFLHYVTMREVIKRRNQTLTHRPRFGIPLSRTADGVSNQSKVLFRRGESTVPH